ncbi:MAG: head-tail connector protein [Alphaproteobacteria bacterium]|nr:head-tail connector protein [Alphaproteobacteria bacterium]MBF0249877.1 head-tail connector protein [Alphaproteobacteria bacterium]
MIMDELTPESVVRAFKRAKDNRATWEGHWRDCYDYALPLRSQSMAKGAKTGDKLFDGTAPDAVDQLAASLLANLTPPWGRWVGLMPGTELTPEQRERVAPVLDKIATVMQSHFDRSNFAVEIHQCYLDLVTAGTASLMLEENALGEASAFRFTAVPVFDVVFDSDASGRLQGTMRRMEMTERELRQRYPQAPELDIRRGRDDLTFGDDRRIGVIEAVMPDDKGYHYMAVAEAGPGHGFEATTLAEGRFKTSPFINFRWLKAPGEIYGRSPVMKALPDIKTANKVVELTLKNASIAVTGIWQADDDGVLNPANIKLVPGAIIPKAVGSQGLTPLETPGRFDISGIVLDNLRERIRTSLLTDKLGQVSGPKMSATEVLERSADMARLLGATFGRLQTELLNPLIDRAVAILRRRGEIPDVVIDGRTIDIDYKSPLARRQSQVEAQNAIAWVSAVTSLGPKAAYIIDDIRAARWLADVFRVPGDLLRSDEQIERLANGAPPMGAMPANLGALAQALETQLPSEQAAVNPAEALASVMMEGGPGHG